MYTEAKQSDDYATGLAQLVEMERQRALENKFHSPVLDWLQENPCKGPTLVFDIKRIEQRMQWLKELSSPLSATALMAVKSCPDPRYLDAAYRHLDGFDISNVNEYESLPEDLEGKLVSVTSPTLNADLNSFVARGNTAVIALDSQAQLECYFDQNPPIPYLLRIQGSDLLEESDSAHYARSRFGFTLEGVEKLFQDPQLQANPPSGFHVHHGSERNTASTYLTFIRALSSLVSKYAIHPVFINLGGGWHGVEQDEIGSVLAEARRAFPTPCAILLEPGQWYSRHAGFAVGTIVNQMQSGDMVRYVVNLSRDCHLKWSKVKLVYPTKIRPKKFCDVQFFGASCHEADMIGRFILPYASDFLQESGFTIGGQVVFSNVSPYSAAWNNSFNGIPEAELAWCSD